jgi:hypothetical protein
MVGVMSQVLRNLFSTASRPAWSWRHSTSTMEGSLRRRLQASGGHSTRVDYWGTSVTVASFVITLHSSFWSTMTVVAEVWYPALVTLM